MTLGHGFWPIRRRAKICWISSSQSHAKMRKRTQDGHLNLAVANIHFLTGMSGNAAVSKIFLRKRLQKKMLVTMALPR